MILVKFPLRENEGSLVIPTSLAEEIQSLIDVISNGIEKETYTINYSVGLIRSIEIPLEIWRIVPHERSDVNGRRSSRGKVCEEGSEGRILYVFSSG